jgi:ketopantoate hydroxymethyltransferase
MKECFANYVNQVAGGKYPAPEHQYEMPSDEKVKFLSE